MLKFITTIFLSCFFASHSKYIDTPEPRTWIEHNQIIVLPSDWYWGSVDGENFLTKNLNQHLTTILRKLLGARRREFTCR